MKIRYISTVLICGFVLSAVWTSSARGEETALSDGKVLMQAMKDELDRSMRLQMEDLEKPYFIQYTVDDSLSYALSAKYGAIASSSRDRSRLFYDQVRVGSYELDNTNFSEGGMSDFGGMGRRRPRRGGGRGQSSLPLHDEYAAIRKALWLATDRSYKTAVEAITQKKAYLKDITSTDRPHDFSKAPAVVFTGPSAEVEFDQSLWEDRLKKISNRFKQYPLVKDSSVRLSVDVLNQYIVNSEGTRLRTGKTCAQMIVTAEVQADDGMEFSDTLSFVALAPAGLPDKEEIYEKIDEMVGNLTRLMKAAVLDSYTGPVLFDGRASAQVFRRMLAQSVVGRPDAVGTQRRRFEAGENLENKIGQRILPKSFQVYDDPTVEEVDGTALLGHYAYDDEGVKSRRVDVVIDGKLIQLLLSRVPTKKFADSTGHGRRGPGMGGARAAVGSLFIEDSDGLTEGELKEELIDAAMAEGLDYGLRVVSIRSSMGMPGGRDMRAMFRGMMRGGGGGGEQALGDPVLLYKVYVEDGREELVCGCEFVPIKFKDLRDIIAAGKALHVDNAPGGMGGAPSSIIAPSVLFEEMELLKIEQENPTPPVLTAPLAR